ncbi:MAG: L-histidine N(alpha)-methyltransferase, partial [Bdellovibrionia bacterium]
LQFAVFLCEHLLSRDAQVVEVGGRQISFRPEETIHTENSHKFTIERFKALAQATGFGCEKVWTDPKNWFAVALLEAKRPVISITNRNHVEISDGEGLLRAV